jgi:hypothetical protein
MSYAETMSRNCFGSCGLLRNGRILEFTEQNGRIAKVYGFGKWIIMYVDEDYQETMVGRCKRDYQGTSLKEPPGSGTQPMLSISTFNRSSISCL